MGILKGALSVRRYRVHGELPDDFRNIFQQGLQRHAFRESSDVTLRRESQGWVEIQNLLDMGFEDLNRWLFDRYLVVGLRVDKRTIPTKLFKAHLEKREIAWCLEHNRERCPVPVRAELKDLLEAELLSRSLPRIQVFEFCWNTTDGWLIFHSLSESANERFRKLFFQTFGLKPVAEEPLDLLAGHPPEVAKALMATGGMDYRPEVPR